MVLGYRGAVLREAAETLEVLHFLDVLNNPGKYIKKEKKEE
jgi:hypothetical protein